MLIVAKIIQAVTACALIALIAPFVLAFVGAAKLFNWTELHGDFGGDKEARDRAHWRNS